MVWGRVLAALDSPVVREEACGPLLPGADPPGSASSTCTHRLRGLPLPPVFFRPQDRGLRHITLGRILTKRCKPNSSQQEQGKSQMAPHLNEPTTVASTVAHADDRSFLGPVVITAHASRPIAKPVRHGGVQVYLHRIAWRSGALLTTETLNPSKVTRAVRPAITSGTSPSGNAKCWGHAT